MSSGLEYNDKAARDLLRSFTGKQLDSIQKKSLRAGAALVLREARSQLLTAVPNARQRNSKYSDTLYDAVRMYVTQDYGEHKYYFKVHAMGVRGKSSGTYRTRFFAVGTKQRKTRRPYTDKLGRTYPAGMNRGKIKRTNFFSNAVAATDAQLVHTIQTQFNAEVTKIVNKTR